MQASLRPTLKKLLWSLSAAAAAAVLTALAAYFLSYLLFPVAGVEVAGARMFPETEVWEALPNRASLPSLNQNALEERIEANPWVKGADVSEDWESGIVTVEVEERVPVLYGELDGQRVVVAADGTELPGLGGADLDRVGLDEARLEEILGVAGVLEENGAALASVDAVDAGGVTATVEGRSVVFGGEVEGAQVRSLVELMEEYPEALHYDLRSSGRVVIGAGE